MLTFASEQTTVVPHRAPHAAVIAAPRRVEMQVMELPVPDAEQVRVRLEGCGVCASNFPVWDGRAWFTYPLEPGAPGHEGWGYIDALGSEVTDRKVGERVAVLSYHAFAEYDLAAAGAVVPLPPALDGKPFPGEPLGCALNILRRSGILAGETVAVVGTGFLGALLVQLAAQRGARVIAIGRRAFTLDLARELGAAETVQLDDYWRAVDQVKQLTGGQGCECVIECAGIQLTLDLAGEIAGERGRLVIAGYHQDGKRQVNMQLWNWRGLDVINAHERDPQVYCRGMREAVQAVAAGQMDPTPLLTHPVALDGLGQAFALMDARPDGFLKAWVQF